MSWNGSTDVLRIVDAKLRALLTYMSKYNALYPGATQVLVLSRQSTVWISRAETVSREFVGMRSAVDILCFCS